MTRGLLLALALLLTPSPLLADAPRPRLVVLLVFDQMRGDYLGRWHDLYGDGGFKRLTGDGAWFTDCQYPYGYTWTGAGHASMATGCLPVTHGIIGNEWHDRKEAKTVNCVGSDRHEQVPPPLPDKDGKITKAGVSPDRLLAPTLSDAMKAQLGDQTRVVCLSLKDRSSTLPGGRRPDACYWVDKNGRVVTSTYYRDAVHPWVKAFNDEHLVDRWHGKSWTRLIPTLDYAAYSGPDEVMGEGKENDQGVGFPHPFTDGPKKLRTNYYAAVANSPVGNDLLLELAKRAIDAEKLGQRDTPDFLSLSFSSNDLVGHCWGPDSQEVLDVTLRSDRLVKELLTFLDDRVGKGKYVVAMTADHGICPLPEVSRSRGFEARRVDLDPIAKEAEAMLDRLYPPRGDEGKTKAKWIEANKSAMFYLNRKRLAARGAKLEDVQRLLATWLLTQPAVGLTFAHTDMVNGTVDGEITTMIKRSFVADRSGDVLLVPKPFHVFSTYLTGTTHGSPYEYDTHVPLVVMGPGVVAGVRKERVSPEHAAVILARALRIDPPAKARVTVPEGLFAK